MRTTITSANGSCKGYLNDIGEQIHIQNPQGKMLGFYVKRQDKTFNRSAKCIGNGNLLTMLLNENVDL